MDRKHFLKLLALAGLAPVVMQGCKKDGPLDDYNGTVVIIGAGAAGLYAAWLLKNAGATVKVLEATDKVGGRIRELTGFADFAIELGAEEVHGQRTAWYDIVFDTDAKEVDSDGEDIYFIDGVRKTENDLNADSGFQKLQTLVNGIGSYNGADQTFDAYLAAEGIAAKYLPLGNALFGNEYGSSNDRLSVLGVAREDQLWTAGNKNFLLKNRSMQSILEEKFASVMGNVQLNSPVVNIDYSGSTVTVTDASGATYQADRVIVTASVAVLRAQVIQFAPALPAAKVSALSAIGMAEGMKVILKFSQAFWPDDTGSIYGSGLVPEWWVTSGGGRSSADHVLTTFVMGSKAAALSSLGTGMVGAICAELDQIFGGSVATGSLIDSHVEDWFSQPYFRGAYSFPLVGMSVAARQDLSAPVAGKLFFAGEATHLEGHAGTVHGALESAYRAAEELVNA